MMIGGPSDIGIPTDPILQILKQQLKPKPEVMELVVCAKCHQLTYWDTIRKLLDQRGEFIEYRCSRCAMEGVKIE